MTLVTQSRTDAQRAVIGNLRLIFGEDNVRIDLYDIFSPTGCNGRGILVWLGDWRKPSLGSMLIAPSGEVLHVSGTN